METERLSRMGANKWASGGIGRRYVIKLITNKAMTDSEVQ